jgi:lipoate-protein ligase A
VLVRLYTWRPGAITIGLNQQVERAFDHNKLGSTVVIRRITGGRALYHDASELTYAIALNLGRIGWPERAKSISQVYGVLTAGLSRFLALSGVSATTVRQSRSQSAALTSEFARPCFESTARYELEVKGRKIVASAQRQIGDAVLQHGAIKIRGLADHPALSGPAPTGRSPQPVDRKEFDGACRRFRGVFGEIWSGTWTENGGDAPSLRYVNQRLKWVREAPLDRRDSFEHSP